MNLEPMKSLTPKMHGIEDHVAHAVTNDELYRRSTQYRFWSFTKDEIEDLRINCNKKGIETFEERISKLTDDQNLIKKYVAESFEPIKITEEREIVVYYARKCFELSNFFKFSSQVRLTSITYLFRFYLIHSVIKYFPQSIMYTCLFLAAKSENNFLGIKNFSKALPKTTPESILKNEYLILDTMRFTLMVHHPLRPLYGFYLDIQNILIKLDFNRLCKDYENAKKILNESIFTDVQFLFTPPQIALASLYIIDDIVCMRYLMRKFGIKRKQMLQKMNEHANPDLINNNSNIDTSNNGNGNVNGNVNDNSNDNENDSSIQPTDTNKSNSATPIPSTENVVDETKPEEKSLNSKKEENGNTTVNNNDEGTDIINVGDGIIEEEEEESDEKPVEKKLTPLEQYERVIKVVKQCAELMQVKIDPSVEQAKKVSLRVHFCHNPVKYFQKITRTAESSFNSNTSTPVPIIPAKRNDDESGNDNHEAKKIKTV